MSIDFSKLFTMLGLSETETKIYFASLHLGPTSVQEIAKKARLSRTAAYDAIASLQDRGLLSTYERGKKKFFTVEDPERAISYFRNQVSKLNDQLGVLHTSLSELKMLAGGERPSARFYEGKDAIQAVFHDVALVSPPIRYEVANYDDVYEHLDIGQLESYRRILHEKKIKMKMIFCGKLRKISPHTEYYRMPSSVGEFHGDIWLYGNRVAFVSFIGKPITVIIESEAFSHVAKALYETALLGCEKVEIPDISPQNTEK